MRKEHAEDHFAYLAAYRDRILLAGGLRNNPAEWFCGGMLVMGVGSRAEAAALCKDGPYFKLGLRESYRPCTWGKGPCYGDVTL